MAIESFTTINVANNTEALDYFCTEMLTGPLVWAIFCVLCVCVGVPASVWLLWVLNQKQQQPTNVYILNLTVMDLLYSIFKLPDILNYFIWRDISFLQLSVFMEGFSLIGRPLFMACICLDCYVAVIFPIPYMKIKQSGYKVVICALAWVFTVVERILFIFLVPLEHSFYWELLRLLPISAIFFCDVSLLYALRKPDPSGKRDIHPQKKRALQTITNSFIMTIFFYLPPIIAQLISILMTIPLQELYCVISTPILISTMLGSVIMPFLHLDNMGSLNALKRLVRA